MNKTDLCSGIINGLVYDTTSAHVIQVVKTGGKSRYHSHRD